VGDARVGGAVMGYPFTQDYGKDETENACRLSNDEARTVLLLCFHSKGNGGAYTDGRYIWVAAAKHGYNALPP
jgi:hypothetical protein